MGSNMSVCFSDGTSKYKPDFSSTLIHDDTSTYKVNDEIILKSQNDYGTNDHEILTDTAWKKLLESNRQEDNIPQLDEEFKDDDESDSEQSVLTELNPVNSPKGTRSPKYPSMCRMERIASVQQMLAFPNIAEKTTGQEKIVKFREILATGRVDKMKDFMQSNSIRVNHIPPLEHDLSSPLHVAIREDNVSMVELLLKYGAAMHAKDMSGRTPLALAFERGNEEVINALTSAKDAEYLKSPYSPYAPSTMPSTHSHNLQPNTFSDSVISAFSTQPSPVERTFNSEHKSDIFHEGEHKAREEVDDVFITTSRNNSFRSINSNTFTMLNPHISNDSKKSRPIKPAVAIAPLPVEMSPKEWTASVPNRIATKLGRERKGERVSLLTTSSNQIDDIEEPQCDDPTTDGNSNTYADTSTISHNSETAVEGIAIKTDPACQPTTDKTTKISKPIAKRLQKAAGKMFSFVRPHRNRSDSGPIAVTTDTTNLTSTIEIPINN